MKKTITLLSIVLLGTTLMSFHGIPECKTECENLQIEDITYLEVNEEIDLGFDTTPYLPKGFDPYAGMGTMLDEINYIEDEKEVDLGFDTAEYLPKGFNAYKGLVFDIDEIEYIEMEDEIDLDFDVQAFLPESFKALSK